MPYGFSFGAVPGAALCDAGVAVLIDPVRKHPEIKKCTRRRIRRKRLKSLGTTPATERHRSTEKRFDLEELLHPGWSSAPEFLRPDGRGLGQGAGDRLHTRPQSVDGGVGLLAPGVVDAAGVDGVEAELVDEGADGLLGGLVVARHRDGDAVRVAGRTRPLRMSAA